MRSSPARCACGEPVDPFAAFVAALSSAGVRFVLIGVWGANLHATSAGVVFTTQDYDLFLPPDADNLLKAWETAEAVGLSLWAGDEPLDMPRDHWLAERIVERRIVVRGTDGQGFDVDLSLVMAGFDFETVWAERRIFIVEGVNIPVARLRHIVESKAAAGRLKDRLFLATHEENLRQLLGRGE